MRNTVSQHRRDRRIGLRPAVVQGEVPGTKQLEQLVDNLAMPRRGLTLLELVVVLTILVALAGLLVPMVSNLLSVSTSAIGATNASEVERMVQLYLGRPNGNTLDLLDNLADSSGDLMSYVPTNSSTLGNATPDIVPYQLTSAPPAVASLSYLGPAERIPVGPEPRDCHYSGLEPDLLPVHSQRDHRPADVPAAVRRHVRRTALGPRCRAEVRRSEHRDVPCLRAREIQCDVRRERRRQVSSGGACSVQHGRQRSRPACIAVSGLFSRSIP